MKSTHDPLRRSVMAAVVSLPLGRTAASTAGGSKGEQENPQILVAYFSRSGNTRVVAGLIQRAHGATLFEIRPASPYPEEYLATVEQARQERDSLYEPALAASVPDIGHYGTVFLGFPIWGETTPPVIRTFLSSHNLAGKALIPFITHGGYGLGSSQSVIARLAPQAKLRNSFSIQGDQERQTMERVNAWLVGTKP